MSSRSHNQVNQIYFNQNLIRQYLRGNAHDEKDESSTAISPNTLNERWASNTI
jgi:hypothetical protein